ncbi:uncharacterized protein LOC141709393 [Apium graveolens]|uniref:uncharacterized protein LOC141709393 n=1 Tax=Apium graveolens TaxID=4045 RepID=UPI003D78D0B8
MCEEEVGTYEDNNVKENNEEVKDVEEAGADVEEIGVDVEQFGADADQVGAEVETMVKKGVETEVGSLEWMLAVGTPYNVVAYTIMGNDVLGGEKIMHGLPLAKENARVSITRVVSGSAAIPVPVGDEIKTVNEAVGKYIAWPRDLILEVNTSVAPMVEPKKGGKKSAVKKWKHVKDCIEEYVVKMGPNYLHALKCLWIWENEALSNDQTTSFKLSQEALGSTKKYCLFLSDVYALCTRGEISASIICIYIHLLYENLKRNKMTHMVAFVDPGTIGAKSCGSAAERSRALAYRFKTAKKGQNHWVLSVVNPDAQVVYHLDPLKRRIASSEWMEVVDNSIKLYKDSARKMLKRKIVWENLAGVSVQNESKDCGLFVMLYMREICEDKEFDFCSKWLQRGNNSFTEDDINDIKDAWAKFFLKYHT